MRIACGLALAIGLSIAAAGGPLRQNPADDASSTGQTPTPPLPSPEKPATAAAPASDERTPGAAAHSSPDSTSHPPNTFSSPKAATNSARRNPKRHKHATPAPGDGPTKVVVRQGGASEPAAQIAPGMTPAEAVRERQNVERLLGATDDQLQMLAGRALEVKGQETVGQIRNYLDQARLALKEGDLRRANTLAQKAHLLSDDLVKR
jgi:hypothetical protein